MLSPTNCLSVFEGLRDNNTQRSSEKRLPWIISQNLLRKTCDTCNLGQKVGDKFTELSKIGFSMEYFTADLLQFFTKKHQNLAFRWTTGYSPSNPSISGIFLKFPNFVSLKSFGNSWGNSWIHFLVKKI